jgi:LysR family transcriptional regulator, glycine cleavage system transcriptional activator
MKPTLMDDDKRSAPAPALNPPSRKSIPPFEALRAFDAVARLRGVRRAAQSLGRDHAVVSRHLRTIEAWTGTRLIDRTSSSISLTEEGLRYHKQIAAAMDAIANATIDLMRRGDNSRLLIWCAPGLALHWMSSRIGLFEKTNRDVQIELRPTDRRPDFASHETDIDIRFESVYGNPLQLAPGLRCVETARVPIIAVASPAYLASMPPIETPRDLLSQRLLHEEDFDGWAHWLAAHGIYDELDLSGPRLWQGHLTLDAAIHGRGVALSNFMVVAGELASGRLVEIGKGNASFQPYSDGIYYFIARADRWDAPLIRRYRRWLIEAIAADSSQVSIAAPKHLSKAG